MDIHNFVKNAKYSVFFIKQKVLRRTNYLLFFDLTPHKKRRLEQFSFAEGMRLPSRYLAKIGGYTNRPTGSPLVRHGPYRKRRLEQFFFAAGKCLPSRYLAKVEGYTNRPTGSPLVRHEPYRKRRLQQFFYCCVHSLQFIIYNIYLCLCCRT
jgi:hypothetical protein